MSGSSRDNSNDLCRIFVKGAEQVTVSKKRARDVNTARGAAAFTAEESTSSYGNFGGLPSNFQSRTPSGRNSQSLLGSSSRPLEASGNNEAASVRSDPLPESNIGFQVLGYSSTVAILEPLPLVVICSAMHYRDIRVQVHMSFNFLFFYCTELSELDWCFCVM